MFALMLDRKMIKIGEGFGKERILLRERLF